MVSKVSCHACGLCYQECVLQMDAIRPVAGGVEIQLEKCNRCGHCMAVCPTGEINNPLLLPQDPVGSPLPAAEALRFLRTARSVRRFKPGLVPREEIIALLNAGRYPQTPKNAQGIGYVVVQGRENVEQIHKLYTQIAKSLPDDYPQRDKILRPVLTQEEKGFDALFYNCPQLIFAICDRQNINGRKNALFSLLFIALFAPSLGLGTCWSGQLETLACQGPYMDQFAEQIGLSTEKTICGCMMLGYPNVKFYRLPERDPLDIQWRGSESSEL